VLKTKEAKNTEVRRGKDLKVKVFSLYYWDCVLQYLIAIIKNNDRIGTK